MDKQKMEGRVLRDFHGHMCYEMGYLHVQKCRFSRSVCGVGLHVPVRRHPPQMGLRFQNHVLRGHSGPSRVRFVHPSSTTRRRDARDAENVRVSTNARQGKVGEKSLHLRGRVWPHRQLKTGGKISRTNTRQKRDTHRLILYIYIHTHTHTKRKRMRKRVVLLRDSYIHIPLYYHIGKRTKETRYFYKTRNSFRFPFHTKQPTKKISFLLFRAA